MERSEMSSVTEPQGASVTLLVVLPRNVEYPRPDHLRQRGQYLRQAVGIVLLVDIGDVIAPLAGRFGVADIVDVEAERFCQVVEPVQFQFFHIFRPSAYSAAKKERPAGRSTLIQGHNFSFPRTHSVPFRKKEASMIMANTYALIDRFTSFVRAAPVIK